MYVERYNFYATLKFKELLDFRADTRFWNAPLNTIQQYLQALKSTLRALMIQPRYGHFEYVDNIFM